MIRRVEQLGLKPHPIYGTERTVIAAIGEKRDEHRQSLESGPGVAEVVPILAPYKVASREVKPGPTVIRAGSLAVGNCHLGMIAGPCCSAVFQLITPSPRRTWLKAMEGTPSRAPSMAAAMVPE